MLQPLFLGDVGEVGVRSKNREWGLKEGGGIYIWLRWGKAFRKSALSLPVQMRIVIVAAKNRWRGGGGDLLGVKRIGWRGTA